MPLLRTLWQIFRTRSIRGDIGYHGLAQWWLASFTCDEREHISQTYRPMTLGLKSESIQTNNQRTLNSESCLTTGDIVSSSQSAVAFLHTLSGWFNNKTDRALAQRILAKAFSLAKETKVAVLDLHFLFSTAIQTYYPERDREPSALSMAVAACREQITMAPAAARAFRNEWKDQSLPSHVGYTQLAIILEKQKDYEEAVSLCETASRQGWAGDWDHRIARLRKKMQKASK